MTRTTTTTYGPCWQCGGSGVAHAPYGLTQTVPPACPRCAGTGQIVVSVTVTEETEDGQSSLTQREMPNVVS